MIVKRFSKKIIVCLKKILRILPGFSVFFRKWDEYRNIINEMTNVIHQTNSTLEKVQSSAIEESNAMYQKIVELNTILEDKSAELAIVNNRLDVLGKRLIAQRFALKKVTGTPAKVIFLIEEPSVIKNVISLITELSNDKRFEVVLLNLWYKEYKGDNYTYKRPNIESVLDVSKYNVIEAYDKNTGKWFSLESLLPDYVFFSRPYDFYRKETYHIGEVSQYARTCYVPYGIQTIGGDVERMVLTSECANLYYFFMDNAVRKNVISDVMKGTCFATEGHLVYLGYPGIDMLLKHSEIKRVDDKIFTVLWLPRWNNSENNCHFFEYKDVLVEYAKKYDDCRIMLRPHPLCFSNFINKGEMTEEELTQLRKDYSAPNEIDETGNYIEAFSASSVLVADETSLIAEYFLTEKPIIFCEKETHFSLLMEKLIEGCYVINSKEELIFILEQLKNGNDTLKMKRKEIAKATLLDYGTSAASNIKEELWNDFTCEYEFH